jgi:hypothetical protein
MTQPISIAKELSSSHGERRIRVLILNPKSKGFNPTTFPETEIERVMGISEDRSVLVLRSGAEIPVALPYEELEQKIYERDFRTDGPVLDLRNVTGQAAKAKAPANTNQAPAPGDKMPDGTVFAGISPDTNKPMYATPADAPLMMKFNQAKEHADKLDAHGHQDWRVPTKAELNVLFNNRAAIGGFDVTGPGPAGWYCSASPGYVWLAWGQRFSDGCQYTNNKGNLWAVRCVR